MNREVLKSKLAEAGVSSDEYLVGGAYDYRECVVFDRETSVWQVFYFERGNKGSLREFSNEAAALWHLYARLVRRRVMSKKLVPVGTSESGGGTI